MFALRESICLCGLMVMSLCVSTFGANSLAIGDDGERDGGKRGALMSLRGGSTIEFHQVRIPDPTDPTKDMPVQWWFNGQRDNRLLQRSQSADVSGFSFDVRTADDIVLQEGCWYHVATVTVVMAVMADEPDFGLEIYDDCDGQPGNLLDLTSLIGGSPFDGTPFLEYETQILAEGTGQFEGLTFYSVTFTVDGFAPGYRRLWIAPYGIGDGEYYNVSANEGMINGRKGQFFDGVEWVEIDDACTNCEPICTDFGIWVDGLVCKVLKDNSDFLAEPGVATIGPPNLATFGPDYAVIALDDFQVTQGEEKRICKLQIWVASNCVHLIEAALYSNECDEPVGDPVDIGPPQEIRNVTELDNVPAHLGLPVYRITWVSNSNLPDLLPGRNYWLAVGFFGSLSQSTRAYWLFTQDIECTEICINSAKYRNPYKGYMVFTDYAFVSGVDARRDHAFKLWVREILEECEDPTPADADENAPGSPGELISPTREGGSIHFGGAVGGGSGGSSGGGMQRFVGGR